MIKRWLKTLMTTWIYITGASILLVIHVSRKLLGLVDMSTIQARKRRLVVISGCDSGLGLTMAKWAADSGYHVMAGCLREEGEGSHFLCNNNFSTGNLYVEQLDVTDKKSINKFVRRCQYILKKHRLQLYAVIVNAAVAVPGEFMWLTEDQSKSQMDVNFWGAVNLANAFQHQLLEHKSRLIVVSSDCSDYPLPGLAMYSASKAALEKWAVALRLELAKYGVTVVAFQPGSFATQSRIMCGQESNFQKMIKRLEEISLRRFYGSAVDDFIDHFQTNFDSHPPPIVPLLDSGIQKAFFSVLEENMCRTPVFICQNAGQVIFHFLIKYLPRFMSDALIMKAMHSPHWKHEPVVFCNGDDDADE